MKLCRRSLFAIIRPRAEHARALLNGPRFARFCAASLARLRPVTLVAALFLAPAIASASTLMFGVTPQHTGWDARETTLTPANVHGVVPRWNSPYFAPITLNGVKYAPHVYGAPLEVDAVAIKAGPYAGKSLSLILAGTTNGDVYAVNAFAQTGVPAGAIVWQRHLGTPTIENFDGGMPLGIESTGVVDQSTGRWYVTDHVFDIGWTAFALDLGTGSIIPGWPIALSFNIAPFDTNRNPGWGVGLSHGERGALNLSLDKRVLYVPLGTYHDDAAGWLVAIDVANARIATSWSSTTTSAIPGAGLWSASGVAVGTNGMLYTTSGNAALAQVGTAGIWGESFLAFKQDAALTLTGSYTPWNLASLEAMDADVGGGGIMLPPDLSATGTTTPHLAVFGGKQGVMYLLDLDHLPGGHVVRQPATSAALDRSLLPPGKTGPLSVFGPYCDFPCQNNLNTAKMRTTPAYFALKNQSYVYATGTPKAAVNSELTVAPCLVRLRIVAQQHSAAYLARDAQSSKAACLQPGSPVVVGQIAPLVWVFDANVTRYQSMVLGPKPFLHVFDGSTMQELWRTTTGELDSGGKFTLPLVTHGLVVVATDRIQAFGL